MASLQTRFNDYMRGKRASDALTLSHNYIAGGEFAEPNTIKPRTNRVAEFNYMQELDKFNDARFNKNAEPELLSGHHNQEYFNFLQHQLDYVTQYTPENYDANKSKFKKHLQAINRCFYSNSIEEIMENLKRENTPFSKLCLENMERNSMLSMKLALKMLRDAQNLDYRGCLLNEINVSLNKVQDGEFDLGV